MYFNLSVVAFLLYHSRNMQNTDPIINRRGLCLDSFGVGFLEVGLIAIGA